MAFYDKQDTGQRKNNIAISDTALSPAVPLSKLIIFPSLSDPLD